MVKVFTETQFKPTPVDAGTITSSEQVHFRIFSEQSFHSSKITLHIRVGVFNTYILVNSRWTRSYLGSKTYQSDT